MRQCGEVLLRPAVRSQFCNHTTTIIDQVDFTYQISELTPMSRCNSFLSLCNTTDIDLPFKICMCQIKVHFDTLIRPVSQINLSESFVKHVFLADCFIFRALSCQPHLRHCFILKRHHNGLHVSSDSPGVCHGEKKQKLISVCIQVLLLMLF